MRAQPPTQITALRQCLVAGAEDALATADVVGTVDAPTGRALAVLALIGATLALAVTPALVGTFAMLDGQIADRFGNWLESSAAAVQLLDHARAVLLLPFIAAMASAKGDS